MHVYIYRLIWSNGKVMEGRDRRSGERVAIKQVLSHTMYLLISFRKPTPSQKHHLGILINNSKLYADDLVRGLTFQN